MKTKMILFLICVMQNIYAQDTIPQIPRNMPVPQHSQFFAFTPISKKINKTNFAFGFGHVENRRISNQTVNGLNLEINPAPIAGAFVVFIAIMHLPDVISNNFGSEKTSYDLKINNWYTSPHLKINGLNLSTGCFFTTTSMNGLNISLANKFKDFNGISLAPLGTISDKQNGISIGIVNCNNDLNGFVVGAYNQSYKLDGLQIGLINRSGTNHGLQLGVYNKSNSRGFQLGIWNVNGKRKLPFINW